MTSPTAASWIFRYQLNDKRREMGLGSYPAVSLADAARAAEALRERLGKGTDPVVERKAKKAAERAEEAALTARQTTFDDCARDYIAAHCSGWKNAKHAQQWTNTLTTFAKPVIGALPVADVATAHVLTILSPIWSTKTETATRVRSRIELVLDFAKVSGLRDGENPARWRGHLDKLLPKRSKVQTVAHHPALAWREIPDLWLSLASTAGSGAVALRFLILTAARTAEVTGASWGEIDFTARTWTIPAARMKAGKEHRVPLTDAALAILRAQRGKHTSWVFPGQRRGRPICNETMAKTLKTLRDDLTVHGFRSTFRVWAGESTRHPRELAELALAHAVGDATEAAYQRSDMFDKRRRLMADWARFVTGDAAVVKLRAAS